MTEIDPEQQLKRGLAGVLKNLLGVGAGAAITMTGVPLWGAGLFVLSIVCGQSSLEAWLSGKSDEELQKQMEFFLDRFEKHLEHAHSKQNRIQTGNLIQHFAKLKEESKGRHDQLSLLLQKIEDDRTQ